jgi:uncharacterized protein YyaL (SSP411 family)
MSQPFRFSPKPNKAHLVHWKEWEEEAFGEAQKAGKPVYLSLSAVWCHWCHVFDETTLSDPHVIEILNRDFICIRVDADKNPHLQSRYLAGGWPTSAFLTPERDIIVAGTYIPPEDFKSLTSKVLQYYGHKKGDLYARMARYKVEKAIERQGKAPAKGGITRDVPKRAFYLIKEAYDPLHGGFGTEPKFPQPEVIEFLIKESSLDNQGSAPDGLEMARKTLDGMMNGELWDTVEKGFFRYCTRANWTTPHYEKMLEGNAGLLKDYLLGYQATGNESYRTIVEGILHYTDTHLSSPNGGFYGSQDADEEYYHLDAQGRGKASPPKIDECVYTDWNGQMISQYLLAYQSLGLKEPLERAEKALNFLREQAYQKGGGMSHFVADGGTGLRGLLADQVYMAEALITAYQTTAQGEYLQWAIDLMEYTIRAFADRAGGGFLDVSEEVASTERLSFREKPFRENSVTARVLIRLFYLTGGEGYKKEALKTLRAFLDTYEDYSLHAALFALAVREYITYPIRIVIVGDKADVNTRSLHQEALRIYPPVGDTGTAQATPPAPAHPLAPAWKVVRVLDPARDPLKIGPLTFPSQASAVAYVCSEGRCSPPLSHPEELKKLLLFPGAPAQNMADFQPSRYGVH